MQRRLVTDHRAHRIGERPFGMLGARIAHQIDLVGEAVIEPREGAVGERAVGVQLGGAGRVEVGAVTLERDQPRPVFGHDGVVVFGKAVVEQIGQAQPPIRLAP